MVEDLEKGNPGGSIKEQ